MPIDSPQEDYYTSRHRHKSAVRPPPEAPTTSRSGDPRSSTRSTELWGRSPRPLWRRLRISDIRSSYESPCRDVAPDILWKEGGLSALTNGQGSELCPGRRLLSWKYASAWRSPVTCRLRS